MVRDPNAFPNLSPKLAQSVKTLTQIAAEAIEGLIAEGALKSGERINESHLAERLGISRGPIREACRSLEQAGLLESVTNRGMFVRALDADEARHLYELRAALAGLAGRLIVQRAPDSIIAALVALVDQMDGAVVAADSESYFRLNLEFHAALIRATGNPALEETYLGIVKQLLLTRRRGLVEAHNVKISNAEHRAIADALAARDAAAAEEAMRRHVDNGFSRLLGSG